MGSKTGIEWAQSTWTPIRARRKDNGKVGVHCERVSEGCRFCYSATFNRRRLPNHGTGLDFTVPNRDLVNIFVDEKILLQPLSWKKPRRIFVCSQTDLFADFVPDEMIWDVFAVMALASQHTFMVLTKRPNRMERLLTDAWKYGEIPFWAMVEGSAQRIYNQRTGEDPSMWLAVHGPLANVWLGVSVEDQKRADERIPRLLRTPAAKRFVSYEPSLGAVNFSGGGLGEDGKPRAGYYWLTERPCFVCQGGDALGYERGRNSHPINCGWAKDNGKSPGGIDWIISGCESGPSRREAKEEWFLSVAEQCQAAGVAHFHKQRIIDGKLVSTPELGGRRYVEFPK